MSDPAFYTVKIVGAAPCVVGANTVAAAYQAGNGGGKMYSSLASKVTASRNVASGGGSAAGGASRGDEFYKKNAKAASYTAGATGHDLVGAAVAEPVIGFTASGVKAGTMAAEYQATLGGTIAAGSNFATLQSVGATGRAASTKLSVAEQVEQLLKIESIPEGLETYESMLYRQSKRWYNSRIVPGYLRGIYRRQK